MIYYLKRSSLRFIIMLSLLIWMLVILPVYQSNMGGSGLALPQNIFSWAVISLVIFLVFLYSTIGGFHIRLTPTAQLFFIGIVILTVPALYTRPEWREIAVWRCAGLIGGWIFYVAILQLRLSYDQRTILLYGILGAVGIQALLALLQAFIPDFAWVTPKNNRIFAIFQQPNALGSFIATGLALSILLILSPASRLTFSGKKKKIILIVFLVVLSMVLVIIQSRAGWIGGALSAFLLLWRYRKQKSLDFILTFSALLFGTAIGISILTTSFGMTEIIGFLNHDGSNSARLAMLQDTISMIISKPLLGWGYGGYEYNLMHYRLSNITTREVLEVTSHPHNEILYWWVEGGIPALAGIVIILIAVVILLYRSWRQDKLQAEGIGVALFLVLLPMLIHCQLEYPFYVSSPHWLVFLLLLSLIDSQKNKNFNFPAPTILKSTITLLSAGVFILAIFSWLGGMALTQAERAGLKNIDNINQLLPISLWVHRERQVFDEQTHALLVYNQTRDETLLIKYREWANRYLQSRIDSNVYFSLIMILRHQDAQEEADFRQREAAFFFPRDMRFR